MSNTDSTAQPTTWTGPRKRWVPIVVLIGVAIAAAGLTWLLTTIFAHQQESKQPFTQVVNIDDKTYDPAIWGRNFPLQYDGYMATANTPEEEDLVKHEPTADGDPGCSSRTASWRSTPDW